MRMLLVSFSASQSTLKISLGKDLSTGKFRHLKLRQIRPNLRKKEQIKKSMPFLENVRRRRGQGMCLRLKGLKTDFR